MDLSLSNYLIIGSYLMGAGSWAYLIREIKVLRSEVLNLRLELAREQGLSEGRGLEERVERLEHEVAELRVR